MADELRVDPAALRHAGNSIARHGETLHALQRTCHRAAQDAHPGWVGSSSAALSELLDGWAITGTAHLDRIGGQSCALHVAASEFCCTEAATSAVLLSRSVDN